MLTGLLLTGFIRDKRMILKKKERRKFSSIEEKERLTF